MFMEHTDKIRFTREDSALLEKYFDMVGQRPVKVDLILGGRSGHALANGVIFLFPGVDLSRATSEGIYADFISMFDPEDMGTLIFCQDEREYMRIPADMLAESTTSTPSGIGSTMAPRTSELGSRC